MSSPNLPNPSSNAYFRTKVLTASPEELRLMLLDGAIRFCRQGREGMAKKDWEGAFNGFSRCRKILTELMTSMRPEVDPDLCGRLTGLYTFLFTQIIEASHEKDLAKADKVIELLEYERDTWALLIEKLRGERSPGADAITPRPAPAAVSAPAAYRPVSVQG